MAKSKYMGIKRKVFLGCIVLAVILFFSSLISIFEFSRMNRYVTGLISDNIRSINAARELLSVSEQYNVRLMDGLVLDYSPGADMEFVQEDELITTFDKLSKTFITPEERSVADSVRYAYAAYMQVVSEADDVWLLDYESRQDWFFNRLQPVYLKFRGNMVGLTSVCQDSLIANSREMQQGFYRSLMPGLISVLVGFLMVLLFYYFLNYYLINPLLKITNGIKRYRAYDVDYEVKIDNTDELADLNSEVGDLIDINESYKKRLEE